MAPSKQGNKRNGGPLAKSSFSEEDIKADILLRSLVHFVSTCFAGMVSYGTGQYLQPDHMLILSFRRTRPTANFNVEYAGPVVISM